MKPITINQLTSFKFLSGLQASPNHQKALFTVHTMDEKNNQYLHNLWLLEQDQIKQLTASDKDLLAVFDGDETVLFASSRQKSSDSEETSFYRIPLTGGEAQLAFRVPLSVSSIEPIADKRWLLTASSDVREPELFLMSDLERKEVFKKRKDAEYVDVLEGIPFWSNGAQLVDHSRERLFTYDETTQQLTPLTRPNFSVNAHTLSDDKERVYIIGSEYTDVTPLYSHLDEINLASQQVTNLIDSTDWDLLLVQELQGELVVASGPLASKKLNQNMKFHKLDRTSKTLVPLDDQELLIGNSIGSDVRFGSSKSLLKIEDTLVYNATIKDHSELKQFNLNETETLIKFDGSIDGFAKINDNWIVIGQYQHGPQELYLIKDHEVSKLSNFNDLSEYYVAKPELFEFESNNDTLTGYVLLPENFDSEKSYPAILDIHGGPKTVYGSIFYHEMQVWASMGYVVFFTNPHGSDGVDDAYSDIFGRYGSIDYDDLMNLTDEVLTRYPNIDQDRLGVTGGSYGGFMTNWIIGHTDRFKVAATQRSISNWISFYGISDIGYFFVEDQTHGSIYSEAGLTNAWEQSPLKYINNMKTPTLILHSKFDYRCPIDQGYQLFTALKNKGVPTRMVVLNEENHDLSRSGKPKARLTRLTEITNWLHDYLKTDSNN